MDYKRRETVRKCAIFLLLLFTLMACNSEKVSAGSISSAEAKVLAAIYETYEYNGESYRALSEYTEQVREYLQQDDVDLSEDQCNELLGMIEANISAAIESGYFVKIENNDSEQSKEETSPDSENPSISYIEDPQSTGKGKKNKGKKNKNKNDNSNTETEENNNNNAEIEQNDNAEMGEDDENKNLSENDNNSSEENKLENNGEDNTSSLDKETLGLKKETNEVGDIFNFWYQADQERKQKETNTIFLIVGIIAILIILFYMIRMIYRYWILYISHPKASSKWKPKHLVDMHCHLLPGVDDGSINMNMTRKLLQMEIDNGVDTIMFTPHFKRGKSRFSNEKLLQIFEETKQEALKLNPNMKLYLGEELYYDNSLCQAIEDGKALKLNKTDYVLVEFSPEVEYKTIHKACQSLIMSGVSPVLAHIERYPALIAKTERLIEIHEMGVYYQMNITSIMGSNFSARIFKQKKLVADGWIDFLGSDSHDDRSRVPKFKKAWKELLKLCDDEMLERIMWENPAKLLAGEDIEL